LLKSARTLELVRESLARYYTILSLSENLVRVRLHGRWIEMAWDTGLDKSVMMAVSPRFLEDIEFLLRTIA
jgi:uncharacterized membrane protein YcjF (UPF0283 family)